MICKIKTITKAIHTQYKKFLNNKPNLNPNPNPNPKSSVSNSSYPQSPPKNTLSNFVDTSKPKSVN